MRTSMVSRSGVTLIELLIALAVSGLLVSAMFSLVMANRKLVETDQARTAVNQNMRSGMDVIGANIRIAGERLSGRTGSQLTAIEVIGGSELILRRNLLGETLPVCDTLQAGTQEDRVQVGFKSKNKANKHPLCRRVDEDEDGWPDNLAAWRDYRTREGGEVSAYIFTPAGGGRGEFFTYDSEPDSKNHIGKTSSVWQNDYDVTEEAFIYALEEYRYRVRDGVLEAVVNGDENRPLRLINGVDAFSVTAIMNDGSERTSLVQSDGLLWSDVAAIEITIQGRAQVGRKELSRELTSRFFPRNALSN